MKKARRLPHDEMTINACRRVLTLNRAGSGRAASRRGVTLLELMLVLAIMVVLVTLVGLNVRGGFRTVYLRQAAEQVQAEWARARVLAIKTGRVHVFHHAVDSTEFLIEPQLSWDDATLAEAGGLLSEEGAGLRQSGVAGRTQLNGGNGSGLGRRRSDLTDSSVFTRRSNSTSGRSGFAESTDQPPLRQLPKGVHFVGADVRLDQRSVMQLSGFDESLTRGSSFRNQGLGLNRRSGSSFGPARQIDSNTNDRRDERGITLQWGMPIYFFPDGTSSSAQLLLWNDREQLIRVHLRGITGTSQIGEFERADAMATGRTR
jgi:prepilin-type N-terminal cleavage/methylation domain-containing protein